MSKLLTTSIPAKKNTIIMMVGIAFFLVVVVLNIIKLLTLNIFVPMEFAFDVLFLVVLFNRVNAKYTCEMQEKALVFTKTSIWGKKREEVCYPSIIGIYQYKPKLVEVSRFRRTYRFHSALDARDVWTLAYTVICKNGKTENNRIYFKPGDLFFDELYRRLADKVMGNDDRVVLAELEKI